MVPWDFLPGCIEEPLVMSRDSKENIHCLSNVCTHRANIIVNEKCNKSNIVCKYHGRRFYLDGKFDFTPGFEMARDFPAESDNLKKLPTQQLGNLIFASLDSPIPFKQWMQPVENKLQDLPLAQLKYDSNGSKDYFIDANWALYCDNYLEGFHIPYVHPSLSKVLDYSAYTTETWEYGVLQTGIAAEGESCFELPDHHPDYGKRIAAFYFWLFPNLMLNVYPWGLSINIVQPTSVVQTRIKFLCFVWDEKLLNQGAGSGLSQVEKEDEEVVQNVQKGICSRIYQAGRYSPEHEKGVHHFHRLLLRFLELDCV